MFAKSNSKFKKLIRLISLSIFFASFAWPAAAGHAQEQDLAGIKCIVNGKKAASVESFVQYKYGKVYFCNDDCAETFKEDLKLKGDAKFTLMANHQLVLTGQYVQKGCPMSGAKIVDEFKINVGGIKVGFCCEGCRDNVAKKETLAKKAAFVFSPAAFRKAFEKKSEINLENVKCMMMPEQNVVAEHAVDYEGGKVFFCCEGCTKKFSSDTDEFATLANQQLVATGQFKQTGCPMSGGQVDDDQASEFDGMTIKFCCEKCKTKFDEAADAGKSEMVFGIEAFAKAFCKK